MSAKPREAILVYFFRCSNGCGEYAVKKQLFRKFVSGEHWRVIERRIAQGASGAVLEFENRCPKCAPKGESLGTVRVLWRKPEANPN